MIHSLPLCGIVCLAPHNCRFVRHLCILHNETLTLFWYISLYYILCYVFVWSIRCLTHCCLADCVLETENAEEENAFLNFWQLTVNSATKMRIADKSFEADKSSDIYRLPTSIHLFLSTLLPFKTRYFILGPYFHVSQQIPGSDFPKYI